MSTEKMREEFETWAASIGRDVTRYDDRACEYACMDTDSDWLCWQASRAALVIQLPGGRSFSASDEPEFARDQCKYAIEAAGVKCEVKP